MAPDGHTGSDEYADHEVQGIGVNVTRDSPGSTEEIVEFEPVSDRGIDSDEVAELVGLFRSATLTPQGAQDVANGNGDAFNGELSLGINTIAESEVLADASSQATIIDTNNGADPTLRLGEIDDPGLLDAVTLSGGVGDTSGATSERFIDMRSAFGTGPFVDRTDDMVLAGEMSAATDDNVKMEASYIMYWAVHEMPEGRASFARP